MTSEKLEIQYNSLKNLYDEYLEYYPVIKNSRNRRIRKKTLSKTSFLVKRSIEIIQEEEAFVKRYLKNDEEPFIKVMFSNLDVYYFNDLRRYEDMFKDHMKIILKNIQNDL